MSLFSRISDIVSSSVNDLLDKAEDPEKMVNQMVRNMETSLKELEESTASALASAKMSASKLAKTERERDLWIENAKNAVGSGDDELAKKALLRKRTLEENISVYEKQTIDANKLANHMREEYHHVKEKLEEARIKRDSLVNRKRAADSMAKLHKEASRFDKSLSNVNSALSSVSGSSDYLTKMEDKIEKQMLELEAKEELSGDNLEREFENLKEKSDLDADLEALKKDLKKS